MPCHIEGRNGAGDWCREMVEVTVDGNRFWTDDEAWAAIEQLREMGDVWASAEYRVIDDDDPDGDGFYAWE